MSKNKYWNRKGRAFLKCDIRDGACYIQFYSGNIPVDRGEYAGRDSLLIASLHGKLPVRFKINGINVAAVFIFKVHLKPSERDLKHIKLAHLSPGWSTKLKYARLTVLERHGLSIGELRNKLSAPREKLSAKLKSLLDRHRDQICHGIDESIRNAGFYKVIDDATGAAYKNIPYLQARALSENGVSEKVIIEKFNTFGLQYMLTDVTEDGKPIRDANGITKKCLDRPIFENVFVPLVAAYRTMRLAKLFNDRNLFPRYKYSPSRLTTKDIVVSEIVTSKIARDTANLGYAADDRQSIRQMLDYGFALSFPRERYYREKFKTLVDGKEEEKVAREGVRFVTPHPLNCWLDKSFPAYTVNSDSGVPTCFYWDIVKYRDILKNKDFWNVEKASFSDYPFLGTTSWSRFQEFYPCQSQFPVMPMSPNQRPDRIDANFLYASATEDKAITQISLFDKIVPADYDLGDYDLPVWMRFLYADTNTVLFAEPMPYTPVYGMFYDYDANKELNSTLALELTPFQQLLGNFLTQHFEAVRSNLLRIAWVNTDIVGNAHISMIGRIKNALFKGGVHLFNYEGKRDHIAGTERANAIHSLNLPQIPTTELISEINLVLSAVERMLGYSAQEVGAPASHEQSATEVNVIASNTGVRIEFIGTGIDEGINAKKRILYEAMYTLGSDEIFAEVADLTPEREAALKELGFTIESSEERGAAKAGVKGKKGSLTMDSFISEREGINRLNDSKIGVAMLQMLGVAMNNPLMFQNLGADQLTTLLNYVLRMMGFPDDFRLKPKGVNGTGVMQEGQGQEVKNQDGQPTNGKELRDALLKSMENIKGKIVEDVVRIVGEQVKSAIADPISQEMQQVVAAIQKLNVADQQFAKTDQQLGAAVEQLSQQDQIIQAALQKIAGAIKQLGLRDEQLAASEQGASAVVAAGVPQQMVSQ